MRANEIAGSTSPAPSPDAGGSSLLPILRTARLIRADLFSPRSNGLTKRPSGRPRACQTQGKFPEGMRSLAVTYKKTTAPLCKLTSRCYAYRLRAPIGELHVGAAFVPPEPTERNRASDPGTKLITTAASRQKGLVDALNVDSPVLRGFDTVGDLDQLARGGIGVGEGASWMNCLSFLARFDERDELIDIHQPTSLALPVGRM
jgi:hypothetical protein